MPKSRRPLSLCDSSLDFVVQHTKLPGGLVVLGHGRPCVVQLDRADKWPIGLSRNVPLPLLIRQEEQRPLCQISLTEALWVSRVRTGA